MGVSAPGGDAADRGLQTQGGQDLGQCSCEDVGVGEGVELWWVTVGSFLDDGGDVGVGPGSVREEESAALEGVLGDVRVGGVLERVGVLHSSQRAAVHRILLPVLLDPEAEPPLLTGAQVHELESQSVPSLLR